MKKIIIADNLREEKLNFFLSFLGEISDMFSIECDYNGGISQDEYVRLQEELKKYFEREDSRRRELYIEDPEYKGTLSKAIGLSKRKDAEKYFDSLLEEDLEVLKDKSIKKQIGKKRSEETNHQDYIYEKSSRIGGTSVGGLYCIKYYKIGDFYRHVQKQKHTLFSLISLEKTLFFNLTFYNKGKMIAQIDEEGNEVICHFAPEQIEFIRINNILYEEVE